LIDFRGLFGSFHHIFKGCDSNFEVIFSQILNVATVVIIVFKRYPSVVVSFVSTFKI